MPRNLVLRPDGKLVNVARKQGQLFICATGCCCGHTERKFAAVPTDLYHNEWERRKLRNKVHLTMGGCLGPCPLANVVLLLFDTHHIWFHSINSESQVFAIYDYIEQMLAANAYLPPSTDLAVYTFTSFVWDGHPSGEEKAPRPTRPIPSSQGNTQNTHPAVLFLSHADTDLLALRAATAHLPPDFPEVRTANPASLQNEGDVDAFLEFMLPQVEMVIVRLLGGRASFAYGMDRLTAWAQQEDKWLVCLPGTDTLDPELMASSTVGVPVAHEVLAYLQSGGVQNYEHCLRFLSDHLLTTGFGFDPPVPQPRHGVYYPDAPGISVRELRARHTSSKPTLGILFYRAHYLSGNTEFVDTLIHAIEAQGANAFPVFAHSLKEVDENTDYSSPLPTALAYFVDKQGQPAVDVIITTMSFALFQSPHRDQSENADTSEANGNMWETAGLTTLNVPILQAITTGSSRGQWERSARGLTPLDTAMNIALPEFDGRIITVPLSFKETIEEPVARQTAQSASTPQTMSNHIVRYRADQERTTRIVGIALRLARLRRKPNAEKRIAVILTNSPAKAARIGNAVGLDAPASLMHLLAALHEAGYSIADVPASGDALIHELIDRCSYDTELLTETQLAQAGASIAETRYAEWFADLPLHNQEEMQNCWGRPPGEAYVHNNAIALAGLPLGNIFVALQPPRGYGMDPNAIYHVPDLPPTHNYYALYHWLRDVQGWNADAIIHLGKHGTLEWLPGKSVGLSETCYPDVLLDDMPLIYPFIINNPGEGAQAKRRTHAVIVDHLVPPMTSAGAYGAMAELAQMVDEYYQVEALDPGKLPALQIQIWQKIIEANLDTDLKAMVRQDHGDHTHEWDEELTEDGTPATLSEMRGKDFAHLLEDIDGYLCELTGAQIRSGLHTLGQLPQGVQLTDVLFSLCRLPNLGVASLREAVANTCGLPLASLLDAPGRRLTPEEQQHLAMLIIPGEDENSRPEKIVSTSASDAIELLETCCHRLLALLQEQHFRTSAIEQVIATCLRPSSRDLSEIRAVLTFVCTEILPRLMQTGDEIRHVLKALDGEYVPAGPSGSPTRGMVHVLPTGRNFYTLDPRALPGQSAWEVGSQLARALLDRHVQETGRYPESVGLSIWGTSALRTQGDDIAQVFALLGVRPQWHHENRRMRGIEVIPLQELGRPRIDVICRISGFFRDAFPHLISMLDEAIHRVAALDEPPEQNYVRRHVQADSARYGDAGHDTLTSNEYAHYRIFGSKPGAYGAGILPLIDERNWQDRTDFAEAYVNWGGYAYTRSTFGNDARSAFRTVLARVTVAAKNQDNREHDLFDSDDYLQFHGGMIATIRALSGKQPHRYIGDSADPQHIRVRDLKEESLRVFRSRVINPKWLAAMRQHGYKGGLELTATVDYLFGYDATAEVMDDWMYEQVAQTYALEAETQDFLRKSNPWALRDIATRLFEANTRGMWEHPDEQTLDALRDVLLRAESDIEGRNEDGRDG
ncbi:MAG: cobaltochelatase subunit CobN [Ktedonobacteraceae bacterium]|nr:cobaltochelatase subunit CobN [Ktedonobacteraceae bacterium]